MEADSVAIESIPVFSAELTGDVCRTGDACDIQMFYEIFESVICFLTDIQEEKLPWNFCIPVAEHTNEITTFMFGNIRVVKLVEGFGWWGTYIFLSEDRSEVYISQHYGIKRYDFAIPGLASGKWVPVQSFSVRVEEGVLDRVIEFIKALETSDLPISS